MKPVRLASLAPRARASRGEPALELQPRVTPRRTLRTTGSAEAAPGREVGARRAARPHRHREVKVEHGRASGPARRIVDGRRSDPGKSSGLTATRRKRVQRSRRRSETNAVVGVGGASEVGFPSLARGRQRRGRVRARERSRGKRPKPCARRQTCARPVSARKRAGPPHGDRVAQRGERREGPPGSSAWPKGQRESGDPRLLTKESIAEVVSERLPVKRRGREVAGRSGWAGRSSLRDGRSGSVGREGAEKARGFRETSESWIAGLKGLVPRTMEGISSHRGHTPKHGVLRGWFWWFGGRRLTATLGYGARVAPPRPTEPRQEMSETASRGAASPAERRGRSEAAGEPSRLPCLARR